MNKNTFFIVCFLCLGLGSGYSQNHSDLAVLKFNEFKPILSLNNDTTYVINFWATWCKPCIEELPYFNQAAAKYTPDEKVRFIMVSLDFPKQIDSKLRPFLSKNDVPGTVLVLDAPDYNNWIPQVDNTWDGAIPVTLVFKGQKREFLNTNIESSFELDKLINKVK